MPKSGDEFLKGLDDDSRDKVRALAKNPLIKYGAMLGVRILSGLFVVKNRFGDQQGGRYYGHGLIEGAILDNCLAYPEDGKLFYRQAENGGWLGYDFNRPKERALRKHRAEMDLLRQGRLTGFLIDEVVDRPSDVRTPTELFNLNNFFHLLSIDHFTGESATEAGLLHSTTYTEAYKAVGAYEQFADELHGLGLADSQVHQVTPKGNGLLFLTKDGGDTTPQHQAPRRSPGLLPGIILGPATA